MRYFSIVVYLLLVKNYGVSLLMKSHFYSPFLYEFLRIIGSLVVSPIAPYGESYTQLDFLDLKIFDRNLSDLIIY